MTLDTLKASKLGKIVVKLVKEPRSPGEFCFFLYVSLLSVGKIACCKLSKMRISSASFLYTIDAVRHVLQNKHVSNATFLSLSLSQITAIKDMASNVERKWRSLINNVDPLSSKSTDNEGKLRHTLVLIIKKNNCMYPDRPQG